MANIKASTLKNRKADTETSLDKVNARILSGNANFEVEFETVDGMQSRVITSEMPVTVEDIRDCLNRQRGIDIEELYAELGAKTVAYLTKRKYLRRVSATLFYVTKVAEERYSLDKPMVGDYFEAEGVTYKPVVVVATVMSPEGETYEITSIAEFSREHNLHQGRMSNLCNGKEKRVSGWTLV